MRDADVLLRAADEEGVDRDVATRLFDRYDALLAERAATPERLLGLAEAGEQATQLSRAVRVLVALGCVLLISASSWWADVAHQSGGYGGVVAVLGAFLAIFVVAAELSSRRGYAQLVGVFGLVASAYAPIVAWAIARSAGMDVSFDAADFTSADRTDGWLVVTGGGLVVASLLYARHRAPLVLFAVSALAATLLGDIAVRVLGVDGYDDRTPLSAIGAGIGALMLVAATALDRRGFRRNALPVHVVASALLFEAALGLIGDVSVTVALLAFAAAMLAVGVVLGRSYDAVLGLVAAWAGVWSLLDWSDGTIVAVAVMANGLLAIGLAVYLATSRASRSRLRRLAGARRVPTPQRD